MYLGKDKGKGKEKEEKRATRQATPLPLVSSMSSSSSLAATSSSTSTSPSHSSVASFSSSPSLSSSMSPADAPLGRAKQKLATYFKSNFDPRLGQIYIPPMGGVDETVSAENCFPLITEVLKRLTTTSLRSLLLLGNSGMGKTCLSLRLCQMMWEKLADNPDAHWPLPLYVYLPQYKRELQVESDLLEPDGTIITPRSKPPPIIAQRYTTA